VSKSFSDRPRVAEIVSSRSASFHLTQLRDWIINEWGSSDPFEGVHDDRAVPPPLLAVDGSHLLGGLAFTDAVVKSTGKIGLWINALFVLPEHRRRGIGSKLVIEAEVVANSVKATELFVYTNVPGLYQKLDWNIIDEPRSSPSRASFRCRW